MTAQSVRAYFSRWYTSDQLAQLDLIMPTPPPKTFCRVNTRLISTESALVELQKYVHQQCLNKGWPVLTVERVEGIPDALSIEMTGPHAIENIGQPEVIVDVHCGAAILRGADVFIPGIVAATSDVEKNCRVSVFVDIDGKCLRGRTTSYDGQRIFVGCGVSQVSRNQVFCNKTENNESSTHNGVGILMTEPIYRTASIGREIGDKFFLQNLPSILVGHALSPTSSDTVLDMCAAPGGKTSHLACLMGNTGRLFALDKSKSKVEKISTLLRALNLADAVQVKCFDSTKCLKNNLFEKESFDCILLDPPCSGVGQRPQFRWDNQMSLENLQSHASYQRKLLSVAIDLLKPGGVLVYSTCTINPEENEENISWVLQNYRSQMQLCDISDMIQKSYGMPNHHVDCSLDSIDLKKILRFDPIDTHGIGRDTIGFFMAKFRKIVP